MTLEQKYHSLHCDAFLFSAALVALSATSFRDSKDFWGVEGLLAAVGLFLWFKAFCHFVDMHTCTTREPCGSDHRYL